MTKLSDKQVLDIWSKSCKTFIEDIWGLIPQQVLPEYEKKYNDILFKYDHTGEEEVLGQLSNDMFEFFERGKHITWQQTLIVRAIDRAATGEAPGDITIRTGHGIGKSNIISKIVIWFLFCYFQSKVGLTGPDKQTLYDALFSEVGKALGDIMDPSIRAAFEKTNDYLRVVGNEDDWFARCKTGKKENPEALAGLHSEYIMLIGEEASGIPDVIFESGLSNLTGKLNLFIMIGNPLNTFGFFRESFKRDGYQKLYFNGEESPITGDYPNRIKRQEGITKEEEKITNDEYRRRILGLFPREDIMDDKGYVQLIMSDSVKYTTESRLYGSRKILGVDCAGEGRDFTTWVIRDSQKAYIVGKEKLSDERSIAQKTLVFINEFNLQGEDVVIDNFGVGANVSMHLALAGHKSTPVYVGKRVSEEGGQKFLNLRSQISWRAKKWLESGGELVENNKWEEMFMIKYTRTLRDEVKIMSKDDMRRQGIKSPDFWDAFTLTFFFRKLDSVEKKNEFTDKKRTVYHPVTGEIMR